MKIEIQAGYRPGAIGRIAELHATYYSQYWNLGLPFEAEVATEVAQFLLRFNPAHDGLWLALLNQTIVGSIVVDGGQHETEGARLRWFILSPECQGQGVGQMLLQEAIGFCQRAAFSQVYLWTFSGLSAARHLYEKQGFVLDKEYEDSGWGSTVTHQRFQLKISSAHSSTSA